MIIPLIARNTTTGTYTCAPENPYCLSTQSNNSNNATTASPPTSVHTSLAHRNLVGVLIIAALLAAALGLSLCFAKWSKPIRRFLRGEQRSSGSDSLLRFGIGDGLAALTAPSGGTSRPLSPLPPHGKALDAEKAVVMPDSSSSRSSLEIVKDKEEKRMVEVAMPAKVSKKLEARACAL
jgi:hypothetical protein